MERLAGIARRIGSLPLFPFLIVAAYISEVTHISTNPSDLIRPILVSWAVMAILIGLLSLRFGSARAGLAVAGLALLIMPETGSPGGLILSVGIIAIVAFLAHIGRPIHADARTVMVLNAAALVAFGTVTISYMARNPAPSPIPAPADCSSKLHTGPDIYVFLLDGYARKDTLQRLFGHDEEPFLTDLEERGFWVDRSSHTTYPTTNLVVPSVLNMGRIQDDPSFSDDAGWDGTAGMIKHSAAMDLLHCAGYEIVATQMPYRDIELSTADRYLAHGEASILEANLLQRTRITSLLDIVLPGFLFDQHRAMIEDALADTAAVSAEPTTRPRFVWTHLISPHPPFVYSDDHGPTPSRALGDFPDPGDHPRDWSISHYVDNIEHLDGHVLDTIDAVVANDPDAVIVVFSDHGSNMDYEFSGGPKNDYAERYGNLFAVRTPGIEATDLYQTPVVPLNILGPLFDHYIGADIAPGPTDAYGRPRIVDGKIVFPAVDPAATPAP